MIRLKTCQLHLESRSTFCRPALNSGNRWSSVGRSKTLKKNPSLLKYARVFAIDKHFCLSISVWVRQILLQILDLVENDWQDKHSSLERNLLQKKFYNMGGQCQFTFCKKRFLPPKTLIIISGKSYFHLTNSTKLFTNVSSMHCIMRLCHPLDGSTSLKYKLLCFKPP